MKILHQQCICDLEASKERPRSPRKVEKHCKSSWHRLRGIEDGFEIIKRKEKIMNDGDKNDSMKMRRERERETRTRK